MPRKRKTDKSLRLHGEIARDIGVKIISGEYKPGEILDGEIAASEHLHVSRTVYREAMRILAAKGLVVSRPKVGTRVSRQSTWHLLDPDVLSWVFEFEPDEAFLSGLFELRRMIEPSAAALAAQRRSASDLEDMERALEAMTEETLATEHGREADLAFHSAILRATGNMFLVSLTSGVGAAISWTTIFKQRDNPLPRDPIPDHRRVYDAIAAGNPNAAYAAMSNLVDLALADTMNSRSPQKAVADIR
ncbi:MAG: FCD domain-containing protein [Alphaproteobacteria bacterium]|nr:FCD domain-containing protein [Alphaproteobacteria bacterium]